MTDLQLGCDSCEGRNVLSVAIASGDPFCAAHVCKACLEKALKRLTEVKTVAIGTAFYPQEIIDLYGRDLILRLLNSKETN